ncbi:hypothetical protein LTR85_010230 [Meristemomyces frigidus]|nr:hypothetical protein LTR85_010230 [Meristemomyces frigidus]
MTWATDYAKLIVTTKELDLGKGNEWKETMVVPQEPGNQQPAPQGPAPAFVQNAQARNRVQLRVTRTGSFNIREIIQYLQSTAPGAEYAAHGDIIQLFNIIMCKPPSGGARVTNAGQNRFYPHEGHPGMEKYDLGSGLQALRGYYASVRPAVGRLLLNLNVTSGAFYKPLTLSSLLTEFRGRNNEQSEGFIRMLKVRAEYKKDKEDKPFMVKIKTIVGFARENLSAKPQVRVKRFGNANEVKFQYTDSKMPNAQPRETSVKDYFRIHHGITLQQPGLPVLNVGTRADPQYLPVELCTVLPGQPFNRLLTGDQTSDMLKFAARFPNLNAMSIAGTAQNIGNGQKLFRLRDTPGDPQVQSVQPWGFRIGVDMLTVPGRILEKPRISYAANKLLNTSNGSWNLANVKFHTGGRFGNWQVLVINRRGKNALYEDPRGEMASGEPLFGRLQAELVKYGLKMGQRVRTNTIAVDALTMENRASNNRILEKAFQDANELGVRLMFVIIPDYDRWLYARIKYYGDIDYGIHTINSIGSKLQKVNGQPMYLGNLALKFNIKGGGVNHTVAGTLGKPLDSNTMLMGIDVTHPAPGNSEGAPSIACVVASTDEYITQWPGSIRTQESRKEMVTGLEEMVIERLDLWVKLHKKLPSKIILYRDGVSEGQYDQVLLQELPSFYKAFEKKYGAEKNWPKVAVIVVGKRHHTRFYPTSQKDADYNAQRSKGSWNPLPGTIVDRHISGRIVREFWLQAHQGLQGTARPAHYVVLKDDVVFQADELETFTHNMCYLFNRATKAVSICPPAYYADLLCERGRYYLHSTLNENHDGASSAGFDANENWTGGVHPRLAESTWYI